MGTTKQTKIAKDGQTRDPIIFEVPYLCNGARWMHGHYGPPIGTQRPGVEWSRDR